MGLSTVYGSAFLLLVNLVCCCCGGQAAERILAEEEFEASKAAGEGGEGGGEASGEFAHVQTGRGSVCIDLSVNKPWICCHTMQGFHILLSFCGLLMQ